MAKNEQRKLERSAQRQAEAEADLSNKVLMRFSENKYYNDKEKPIFEKGKVYALEGAGWIQRWIKRGGEVVKEDDASGVDVLSGDAPKADIKNGIVDLHVDKVAGEAEEIRDPHHPVGGIKTNSEAEQPEAANQEQVG